MRDSIWRYHGNWIRNSRGCSSGRGAAVKLAAGSLLLAACASGDPVPVHGVQGESGTSPLDGRVVQLRDTVVTAMGPEGFFVRSLAGDEDDDARTSEGLYVFTGRGPGVHAGDVVRLRGRVIEFHGHTQLVDAQWRTGRHGPVPEPLVLENAPAAGWESLESMRVKVTGGVIAGPTDRHGDARVVATLPRPMGIREPGGAKRLFELDPDGPGGDDRLLVAGSRFDAVGPLVFRHGDYVLWPERLEVREIPALPGAVREPAEGEIAVATFNLRLFRDERSSHGEPAVPVAVLDARLGKIAAWLSDVLRCPAVVAVQEVEHGEILRRIANRAACDYAAFGAADRPGLELGYLVKESELDVAGVRELKTELRLSVDNTPLFDRPPLALHLRDRDAGRELVLINVHLRSLIGIHTGDRVPQKRLEQAEALRRIVEALLDRDSKDLVVLGDFNAFPYSDGVVDVLARVSGARGVEDAFSAPGDRAHLLDNHTARLERADRYSTVYRGRAQLLDHVLGSRSLRDRISGVAIIHGNADAPEAMADDSATLLGASDHDPVVVYLRWPNDAR